LWVSIAQLTVLFLIRAHVPAVFANWASITAWLLIIPAISSFMVMNFTGTTTFTSLSGVMREMKYAVPVQIVAAIAGIILWITSLFITGA
jgi:acetyl-CoA decarbonylase/synthase complex subunit gamma